MTMDRGEGDERLPSAPEPEQSGNVPARASVTPELMPPARITTMLAEDDDIGLDDLWRILRRQWWVIAGCLGLTVGGATLYTWSQTPQWEASTLIRIENESGDPFANPFMSGAWEDEIETEMQVVATSPIARGVVERLGLRFGIESPSDLYPEDVFAEVGTDTPVPSVAYQLNRVGSDRWTIRALGPDEGEENARTLVAGERVELDGAMVRLAADSQLRARGIEPPEEIRFYTRGEMDAIEAVLGALSVSRPDPKASLFRISYRGTKRELVPEVANGFAAAFIDQRRSVKKTEARSTASFLRDQTIELRAQLEAAERELTRFREREQVVALETEAEAQVMRLAELQTDRTQLLAESNALQNLLESIRVSATGRRPDYRKLIAFPRFLSNGTVQNLVESLIASEEERTRLRARWTPEHPGIRALDTRIEQLENELGEIGRNYLGSLNDQLASTDAVLARFGSDLETIPGRELQYARLMRRTELLAELSSMLETRLAEAKISEAVEDPSARVVEPAVIPRSPVRPRPGRNLALAGFFGLVAGFGLAFVRDQMNQKIRADDHVDLMLGIPVLSRVPPIEANGRNGVQRRQALVTHGAGRSLPAESYRALRTNVMFARTDRVTREMVVTSPAAKDGKSVTASNLAVTFAQHGRKTLLVDADLRRSVQHSIFGIDRRPGLSEFLGGRVPLTDVVRPTTVPDLFLVPAGATPPNPSELLGGPLMTYLLQQVRETYDAVVFDTPPVLAVTDAAVIGGMADGVLLVVRAGRTHRHAAQDAIAQLRRVGSNLLGVVVNDVSAQGRYGYGYRYYQDYYGTDSERSGRPGWMERLPLGSGGS